MSCTFTLYICWLFFLLPLKCPTSICWRFWPYVGWFAVGEHICQDEWTHGSEMVRDMGVGWGRLVEGWRGGGELDRGRGKGFESVSDGRQAQAWSIPRWRLPQAPGTCHPSLGLFSGRMTSVCILFCRRECQSCSQCFLALSLLPDGFGRGSTEGQNVMTSFLQLQKMLNNKYFPHSWSGHFTRFQTSAPKCLYKKYGMDIMSQSTVLQRLQSCGPSWLAILWWLKAKHFCFWECNCVNTYHL